jgi:hypothetical protein
MPDHDRSRRHLVEDGLDQPGITLRPQHLVGQRSCPKSGKIYRKSIHSGQSLPIISTTPSPTMKGQDTGRAIADGLCEQGAVSECAQSHL